MAYGGHGDVGMPGRPTPAGDIAGEGRGSPGAPLAGGRGDTGGLGGQGRGLPAASRGGGESSGTAGGAVPPAEPETIQDNAAPATPDEGISNAGGAGSIGEEERIAGNALGGQGSAGRESMTTEGTPAGDQADRHGTEGSDKPSRYRGETRRPSGPDEADSDSG